MKLMISFARGLSIHFDGRNNNRYTPVSELPPSSNGVTKPVHGQQVQLLKATVTNLNMHPEDDIEISLVVEKYPNNVDEAPAKGLRFKLLWDDRTEKKSLSANGGEADFNIVFRPKNFAKEYHKTPTTGKKIVAFLACRNPNLAHGLVAGEYQVRFITRSKTGTIYEQGATIKIGSSWNEVALELSAGIGVI